MNALDFYNEKECTMRKDTDSFVRNTHNFIKSILITRFLGQKKRVLDLGCGQGGDLSKIIHFSPSLYVGVDIAPNALYSAQKRVSKIKMKCRCHFLCFDFSEKEWTTGFGPFDLVNCQFAIHFAFKSQECAKTTIKSISNSLKNGGLFIGTVPKHNAVTFSKVTIKLPDDNRLCEEYAVEIEYLISICEEFDLHNVLLDTFDKFYKKAAETQSKLKTKMNAFLYPDPNNYVFAFQKKIA